MAINYSMLAFFSGLGYMRIYRDYALPPGGGSIAHNLGYIPYNRPTGLESGEDTLVPLQSGDVVFPSGSAVNYVINVTDSDIIITENSPPINPIDYFVRVYEDPLP